MKYENPLAGAYHLLVEKGPDAGLLLPLTKVVTTWGRPPLTDRHLSRSQLAWRQVFHRGHRCWEVINLSPQTPVYYRRFLPFWRKIHRPTRLHRGSKLRLGSTMLSIQRRPFQLQAPQLKKPGRFRWTIVFSIPMFIFLPLSLRRYLHLSLYVWWGLAVLVLVGFIFWILYRYLNQLDPAKALLLTAALSKQLEVPRSLSLEHHTQTISKPPLKNLTQSAASSTSPGPWFGAALGTWNRIWAKPGEHLCFLGSKGETIAKWWSLQCLLSYPNQLSWQNGQLQTGKGPWQLCLFSPLNQASSPATQDNPETAVSSQATEQQIIVSWAATIHQVPAGATRVIATKSRYYPTENWWQQVTSLLPKSILDDQKMHFPKYSLKTYLQQVFFPEYQGKLPRLNPTAIQPPSSQPITLPSAYHFSAPHSPIRAIYQAWQKPATGLITTIGYGEKSVIQLDLAKDGPHALLAGTTGSGKSVALLTWLLGLTFQYSPRHLLLILVDYKGGEAFQQLANLPHVCGVLTDLTPGLTLRAIRSLQAEIRFREQYKARAKINDLPRIVIAVDEFAILKSDHPQVMAALIRLATLGRSLGIHLILATQRPSGVVDAQIKANLPLRICLRVLENADSVDILGDARAAKLPGEPGRAWIQTSQSEYLHQVQFFWTGNEHFIQSAVSWIDRTWQLCAGTPPRRPWADPLPAQFPADSLPPAEIATQRGYLGLADLPDQQRTAPFSITFPLQAQIISAPRKGKTNLLWQICRVAISLGQTAHFISLTDQKLTEVNGTFANQPQLIKETITRFLNGQLPGVLLIDQAEQIIEELDRVYGPLTTVELFTSLIQQARSHKHSLFIACQPSLATARFAQGFPVQIVGSVRDAIQAAQIGLSKAQREQLNEPGLFIYQPHNDSVLFKAAYSTSLILPDSLTHPNMIPSLLSAPPTNSSGSFPLAPNSSNPSLSSPISLTSSHSRQSNGENNPNLYQLFPLPKRVAASSTQVLGQGFTGMIPFPASERPWVVVGPGGSGRSSLCRLLHHQYPSAIILDDIENDLGNLEQWFLAIPRPPAIIACYPTTIQNGYTAVFNFLRNQAYFAVLGDAKICRQFTARYQSESLPDHTGILPGRGMFIDRKYAKAIQFAYYDQD